MILVKLHQFDPEDRNHVVIDTTASAEAHLPLYSDRSEDVRVERIASGADLPLDARGGSEVFVIAGTLSEGGDTLSRWDWLRLPTGGMTTLTAGPDGAEVWIKSGHLREIAMGTLDAGSAAS